MIFNETFLGSLVVTKISPRAQRVSSENHRVVYLKSIMVSDDCNNLKCVTREQLFFFTHKGMNEKRKLLTEETS